MLYASRDCASPWEQRLTAEIKLAVSPRRKSMKTVLISTVILGLGLMSAAQAKGCIKGAIVGGLAGHMAGHGKVGAAAGCAIGHHEANKSDGQKGGSPPAAS